MKTIALAIRLAFAFAVCQSHAAEITITIPDAVAARTLNAFCAARGYQAQVPHATQPGVFISNPETKLQFVKRILIELVKADAVRGEADAAAKTARDAAEAAAKSQLQVQ